MISLFGLFAMGLTYLYGVALAAIIAVLVVMAAAITLLPALLGFAGAADRAPAAPGPRARPARFAGRWSRAVQRRPWTAATAGIAVLLVLASPATGLRLGFPDAGNDRAETTTRQAFDLVTRALRRGRERAARRRRARRARPRASPRRSSATPGSRPSRRPQLNPAGDTALILANPKSSPQAPATEDTLARLRDGRLGEDVVIGGRTAQAVDQARPPAPGCRCSSAVVVGLSLLLLLVAFRSVTVALKAAMLNLFCVAAAYGVVALLAQGGWAGQLVGIDTATPVPPFIPVIMFATLFGLSMDYEVFLLSRVREAWLRGRDTVGRGHRGPDPHGGRDLAPPRRSWSSSSARWRSRPRSS